MSNKVPVSHVWFYKSHADDAFGEGPLSSGQVMQHAKQGLLTLRTEMRSPTATRNTWVAAEDIPALAAALKKLNTSPQSSQCGVEGEKVSANELGFEVSSRTDLQPARQVVTSTPRIARKSGKAAWLFVSIGVTAVLTLAVVVGAYIIFNTSQLPKQPESALVEPIREAAPSAARVANQETVELLKKQNELLQQQLVEEQKSRQQKEMADRTSAIKDLLLKKWARVLAQRADAEAKAAYDQQANLNRQLASLSGEAKHIPLYVPNEQKYYEAILKRLREELETASQEELLKKAQELNVPMP